VDWKRVEAGTTTLLKGKTKDLVLAAYLAHALQVNEGVDGLTTGMTLMAGLLDRYWESMQPDASRMRGRANALQWFLDRAVPGLQAMPEGSASAAQADTLERAAVRLGELAQGRLGQAAPAFGSLVAAVTRLRPSTPVQAVESATPAAVSMAAGPAYSLPAPPAVGGDPREALERIGATLVDLAARIREAAPTDPAAYRTARMGLWMHLDAAPAASGGRTAIPALPTPMLPRLALLEQNVQWAALLEEAESALPRHRFALDLHRFSWLALQGLGPDYDRARAAVASELRVLLARMPGLPGLAFSDGTGLADARTKAWIEDVVLARPPPARAAGPELEDAPPALEEVARKLVEGRIAEALEGFRAVSAQLPPGRRRFLVRLEFADTCARAGLTQLALAMYQGLDADAQGHRLDEWDPALAASTLKGLIATLREIVKDSRGTSTQLDDYYRRLCSLDPAAAYEVRP
jgi:type VI secretion system protein VasJ